MNNYFDLIINTISVSHDINKYLSLLHSRGAMAIVGAPPTPYQLHPMSLISGNRRLAGSLIGGLKLTQEMLDFCGKHKIVSDVEVIPAQQINAAYERMLANDVRYRFVIDASTI